MTSLLFEYNTWYNVMSEYISSKNILKVTWSAQKESIIMSKLNNERNTYQRKGWTGDKYRRNRNNYKTI